jgi:hypothetical protein
MLDGNLLNSVQLLLQPIVNLFSSVAYVWVGTWSKNYWFDYATGLIMKKFVFS